MDYEYVVEVRDYIRDVVIERETFDDANTAYHNYRALMDEYHGEDNIIITLDEPE